MSWFCVCQQLKYGQMRIPGHRVRLSTEHMLLMQIPRRHWKVTFGQAQESVQEVIGPYLADIEARLDNGEGLMLWGDNSTGKSGAACVIAMEARRLGEPVLFITEMDLINAKFEDRAFGSPEDGMLLVDRARTVDLLVLDDLGKGTDSAFTRRFVEELFRERIANLRTTVVTTNIDLREGPDELVGRYSKSMVEVMKESIVPYQIKGENVRERAQMELRGLAAVG